MSSNAIKLNHDSAKQFEEMLNTDRNAFAKAIWDDPLYAINVYNFWSQLAQADERHRITAELEMRAIEAYLMKVREHNCNFHGVQTSAVLDSATALHPVDTKNDAPIEEILPEVKEPEKEKPTLSIFSGKEMGEKPEQVELSKMVKKLLSENKEKEAIALATQYFGSGNYTPKHEHVDAKPWPEGQIESFINSLKKGLKKKQEESTEDSIPFSSQQPTLELESAALKKFASQYVSLTQGGSEDVQAAEELANMFFKERLYSSKQVNTWKQTVTQNDQNLETLDHFAILGPTGSVSGELIDGDMSFEQLSDSIKNDMNGFNIDANADESVKNQVIDRLVKTYAGKIKGASIKNSNNASYDIYTILHAQDLITRIVEASFPTSSSGSQDENKKETGGTTKKEPSAAEIIRTIVKNGGVLEDAIDNVNFKPLVGENKEFDSMDSANTFVKENFNVLATDYKNSLTTYPVQTFNNLVTTAFENDVSVEDFVKEAKDYLQRPDGKFLTLFKKGSKDEPDFETVIEDEKTLTTIVEQRYSNLKKLQEREEAEKAAQLEDATVVDETSDSNEEEDEGITIKYGYLESQFNKAIKRGVELQVVIRNDNKIQSLIANGGTLVGPEKSITSSYDTSAESLDNLTADLQHIWDTCNKRVERKKPNVVDKIKNLGKPKEEDSKEEEVVIEAAAITSINQMMPAGVKMIKEGCSQQDLLNWGKDVLLHRKMDEQQEGSEFKSSAAVDRFIEQMFKDFFNKESEKSEEKETGEVVVDAESSMEEDEKEQEPVTEDYLRALTRSLATQEGIDYKQVAAKINKRAKEGNSNLSVTKILELVREEAPELHNAYLEEQEAKKKKEEELFVRKNLSESKTDVWDIVKDFTTLDEIYSESKRFCEAGEWKDALNMALELIQNGNIEGAENWTEDQTTSWFENTVLGKDSTPWQATVKEPEKKKEELEPEFKALREMNGKGSFTNAMVDIFMKHSDSEELRKKMINIIRGSKTSYGKRMAKASAKDLHNKIQSAKVLSNLKKKE